MHGELQQLDQNLFKAPNFADGSSHAPSSPVYVGGAGMQIKLVGVSTVDAANLNVINVGAFEVEAGSFARFSGETSFRPGSFTAVDGTWRYRTGSTQEMETGATLVAAAGSTITVNGALEVGSGGTAHFAAGSTTTVDGTINFNNAVVFAGISGVAFTVPTFFTASARFSNGVQLKSPMTASDTGRLVKRTVVIATASGAPITAYGPGNADNIIVRALTANTGLYIDGGVDGDEMTIVNKSSAFILQIFDGINFVFQLKNATGGSSFRSVHVVRVAGAWEVLQAELAPGGY